MSEQIDIEELKKNLFYNIGDNTILTIPMSEGDKLNRALYEFCLENKIDAHRFNLQMLPCFCFSVCYR